MRRREGKGSHDQVSWVEAYLNGVNRGQGIGFTIGLVVVDQRTLTALGFSIISGMSTLIVYFAALGKSASSDEFPSSERDGTLAQKLGQLQSFIAVSPTGKHGPTCIFWASLTPFLLQRRAG